MRKVLGEAPLDIGGWLNIMIVRLTLGIVPIGGYIYQLCSTGLNVMSILNVLTLLYIFFALVMLFRRHKAFPGIFIGLEAFSVLNCIVLLIISSELGSEEIRKMWIITAESFRFSVIAVLYILLSKRVKKTFVLNWDKSVDQRLVDKANGIQA